MILDIDFDRMLDARDLSFLSNCSRRKIGVYIPLPHKDIEILQSSIGGNHVQSTSVCCSRELGYCPATHAEVSAIMNLGSRRLEPTALYIWAECPCHACLNFIAHHTFIRQIYCLTQDSYGVEYPRVLDRTLEIMSRLNYAKQLKMDVFRLDRSEILDYENENRTKQSIQD